MDLATVAKIVGELNRRKSLAAKKAKTFPEGSTAEHRNDAKADAFDDAIRIVKEYTIEK